MHDVSLDRRSSEIQGYKPILALVVFLLTSASMPNLSSAPARTLLTPSLIRPCRDDTNSPADPNSNRSQPFWPTKATAHNRLFTRPRTTFGCHRAPGQPSHRWDYSQERHTRRRRDKTHRHTSPVHQPCGTLSQSLCGHSTADSRLTCQYISISLDAAGLIRFLAFFLLSKSRSGRKLYVYLYLLFFLAGVVVGNDPVVLSGTAFLAYMTRVAGIAPPTAWIFAQFSAANIGEHRSHNEASATVLIARPRVKRRQFWCHPTQQTWS